MCQPQSNHRTLAHMHTQTHAIWEILLQHHSDPDQKCQPMFVLNTLLKVKLSTSWSHCCCVSFCVTLQLTVYVSSPWQPRWHACAKPSQHHFLFFFFVSLVHFTLTLSFHLSLFEEAAYENAHRVGICKLQRKWQWGPLGGREGGGFGRLPDSLSNPRSGERRLVKL